jgi:hypothetical protein
MKVIMKNECVKITVRLPASLLKQIDKKLEIFGGTVTRNAYIVETLIEKNKSVGKIK